LAALDGRTYKLDGSMCVIADDDGVLSLGGVIGGDSTGCTEATRNVVVEAAMFDPIRTAMTGRKLGIESDARYRFERGVDPASTEPGIEAATQMILDLCGGEASALTVAGAAPQPGLEIAFSASDVQRRGGVEVTQDRAREILAALGFSVHEEAGGLRVQVPSWRPDVEGRADLVEEVLRVEGYGAIPAVPLPRPQSLSRAVETPAQRRSGFAKRCLAARGLNEAVTFSFVARAHAELFGGGKDNLRLANPISSELTDLRPSLLPALIAAAGRNAARGFADLGLFEIGPAFGSDTPEGQELVASGLRAGASGPRHWASPPRAVDPFDAKADALAVLAECGAPVASLQVTADAPGWYHPGRSGVLRLGPKNQLAHFGEIHPRVLAAMDVAGPVVGFEVLLSAIPLPKAKGGKARGGLELSPFQAVRRDFAFVVDDAVAAAAVVAAIRGAAKGLIADVGVFDAYRGKGVSAGQVSLACEVTLQPTEGTLSEAEIETVSGKIVAAVEKATGGVLRS
jgi:phenylalanyl-tRNA synthetase beta chain